MPKKLDLKIPLSKRTRNAKRPLAKYFGITTGAIMLWEKGDRELHGPALKLLELFEKKACGKSIDFTMESQK